MKKHLKQVYRKTNQEDKTKFKYVLTQNERNYPIREDLLEKFFNSLNQNDLCFYPNTESLKNKICKYYKIEKENLLITPGSTFGIKTIFEAFDVKGKNVITSDYFFPMYQVFSDLYQVELRKAKYKNMRLDMADIRSLIKWDTKFSCVHLLKKYPNLIVVKTFSKAYGAAGCRVGFVISSKENMEYLSKFRAMYEINAVGSKYTEFILDNIQEYNSYIRNTFKGKYKALTQLNNAGYSTIDTDASWFFVNRFDKVDNLKQFNKLGISFRTVVLPNGFEYIKFNYDLKLHYDNTNPFK